MELRNQKIAKAHLEDKSALKEVADWIGAHYTTFIKILRKKKK